MFHQRARSASVSLLTIALVGATSALAPVATSAAGGSGWSYVQGPEGDVAFMATDDAGHAVPARVALTHETLTVHGRQTYRVIINAAAGPAPAPQDLISPAAIALASGAYQQGECNPDPSYSVNGCMEIDFNLKDDGILYYADARAYETTWTRMDTQAVLVSSRVDGAAEGRTCTGLFPLHTQTLSHPSVINGYTYYDYPSWAGNYVQLNPAGSWQRANGTLTWKRGTKTYSFAMLWALNPNPNWPKYNNC